MPEGPEVKRMALDLAKVLSNKTLESVEVVSGRYTKKELEGLTEVKSELPTRIIGVGCHGKFLYMLTSSGYNIWCTLGMTGRWTQSAGKHTRIRLGFEDGPDVNFEDPRNFGTLKFVSGKTLMIKKLQSLGPDLLSDDISSDFFIQRVRNHNNKNITKVLMDQQIFAGIGNYIKAEGLWLSEINPTLLVKQISDSKLEILYRALREVMAASFESGGATFKSHKSFSDTPGNYASKFLCYGRKIDAEGNIVEKIETPDGRKTHWAPNKQGEENEDREL